MENKNKITKIYDELFYLYYLKTFLYPAADLDFFDSSVGKLLSSEEKKRYDSICKELLNRSPRIGNPQVESLYKEKKEIQFKILARFDSIARNRLTYCRTQLEKLGIPSPSSCSSFTSQENIKFSQKIASFSQNPAERAVHIQKSEALLKKLLGTYKGTDGGRA